MKIFMHWDMEGVSGLFQREQTWFWEEGVRERIAEEGRQLLIADMNSAAAAALEAGADELIICDTHHGGGNIRLPEMLADPRIRYLERSRGYDGTTYRWMPGMDETVAGLMLMGHHAKAGTEGGFMHHTQNLTWADFRINGQDVGEMGIEACFAGHWGVPPVLAHGDEAACKEAEDQFPGIVTAAVKRAESYDLASGPDAESSRELTAERVALAVEKARTGQIQPYRPALPMTVTLRLKTVEAAEAAEAAAAAAQRPGVERIDMCTVQGRVDRQCDVMKWIVGTGLDMRPQVAHQGAADRRPEA